MTDADRSPWAPWTLSEQTYADISGPDGRMFRLLVSKPQGPAPAEGWPCLVVLDGNRFFQAAAGAASTLAHRPAKTGVSPMATVGLVHLPQGGEIEDQRTLDFTTGPCSEAGWTRPQAGGKAFRTFLAETILPRLKSSLPIDPGRMALFGHSLAGLFVLETLETAPDLFARWISISPSLWWRTPEPKAASARLLVGCGEREQNRAMRDRIEDWVSQGPAGDRAVLYVAPRADHGSAPFALLPDALRWACA